MFIMMLDLHQSSFGSREKIDYLLLQLYWHLGFRYTESSLSAYAALISLILHNNSLLNSWISELLSVYITEIRSSSFAIIFYDTAIDERIHTRN